MKWLLPLGMLLALGRMTLFVNRWAVNAIYWDQWDFLGGMFAGDDLVTIFRWQHGPHRQGLGGLLIAWLYQRTHWDTKAEAFVAVFFVFCATLSYLWLKLRVTGRALGWADLIIPLTTMTLLQHEIFVGPQNLAHGPIPMALVALTACCISLESSRWKYALLSLLGVVSVYTGFAFFSGPLMLLYMASEAWRAPPRERRTILGWFTLAVIGQASFFVGYKHQPAVGCYKFPDDHPLRYIQFMAALFGRATGAIGTFNGPTLVPEKWLLVGCVFTLLLWAFGASLYKYLRHDDRSCPAAAPALYLSAFSLCFGLFAAIGRVCLGISAADASRYVPFSIPGMIAVYLAGTAWTPESRKKHAILFSAFLLLAAKEWRLGREHDAIQRLHDGKAAWTACIRTQATAEECNERSRFLMHPSIDHDKLEFLKIHRLSFFSDD